MPWSNFPPFISPPPFLSPPPLSLSLSVSLALLTVHSLLSLLTVQRCVCQLLNIQLKQYLWHHQNETKQSENEMSSSDCWICQLSPCTTGTHTRSFTPLFFYLSSASYLSASLLFPLLFLCYHVFFNDFICNQNKGSRCYRGTRSY